MKNNVVAYAVGVIIFALVVGVWVWQLPNSINKNASKKDKYASSIFSVFTEAKGSLSADLEKARLELDKNSAKLEAIIKTQDAEARTIVELKKKVIEDTSARTEAVIDVPVEPAPEKPLPPTKTNIKK